MYDLSRQKGICQTEMRKYAFMRGRSEKEGGGEGEERKGRGIMCSM